MTGTDVVTRSPVLIVSADPDTRDMYVYALQAAAMDVHGRTSADEVVAFAAKTKPAAIVLDVRVRADWHLCRRFRREPATSGVPVIAISGFVAEDRRYRRLASRVGCAAFLAKPSLPDTVRQVVGRVLRGERGIELLAP